MLTQFPNQTCIYTPISAYTPYRYGTSPHQEYLLEFTSEYGISEALHPELPRPEDMIVDFPEGKRVFLTIVDWHTSAPKDGMPAENTYSLGEHTLYPNPETTRSTNLLGRIEPQILPGRRDMDLFNLICAPNPTKVKTSSRPHAAHEVPLLTVIANRVIEMEDPAATTDSSGKTAPEVPPPDNVTTIGIAPEAGLAKRVVATESTRGEKSLVAIELGMGSTRLILVQQGAPVDVSDPDLLSFVDPQSRPSADVTEYSQGVAAAEDPKSENTSFASMVGSLESIYWPEWGITNGCLPDVPEACQDLVDHIASPGYFLELRHFHNDEFLKQYNVNLARQVAMGSQLRLRFEQEAKLLRKSVAQVARRDKRIQARENEIKNLETLLEVKADMKRTAENKGAELSTELETMHALFFDLQVSNDHLSQQVSSLQEQVIGEEKLKAASSMRITGCMIERGLRLAVMKCGESTELRQAFTDVVSAGIAKGMSEGLKHGVEHGKAKVDLEAIEAYDLEAEAKYIAALHTLKNQMYPLVDQLESQKDAPIDVIMASLHLENDTGDDTPQWIQMLLADAITANISRAEKKKKCRVVCRTHEVGSAHHAQFDGIPVSLPTVTHQGLAILLVDAATQTQTSDEASPQLLRSSSLPVIHG
nr:transposase (putative), gypsy type [Tanacetum cinerariifolium]